MGKEALINGIKELISQLSEEEQITFCIFMLNEIYKKRLRKLIKEKKTIEILKMTDLIDNGLFSILDSIFTPEEFVVRLAEITMKMIEKYPRLMGLINAYYQNEKTAVGLV